MLTFINRKIFVASVKKRQTHRLFVNLLVLKVLDPFSWWQFVVFYHPLFFFNSLGFTGFDKFFLFLNSVGFVGFVLDLRFWNLALVLIHFQVANFALDKELFSRRCFWTNWENNKKYQKGTIFPITSNQKLSLCLFDHQKPFKKEKICNHSFKYRQVRYPVNLKQNQKTKYKKLVH